MTPKFWIRVFALGGLARPLHRLVDDRLFVLTDDNGQQLIAE